MIATCNVKVNGRWYKAGEEVPEIGNEKAKPVKAEKPEPEQAGTVEVEAEVKAEEAPKPRTATRRKSAK